MITRLDQIIPSNKEDVALIHNNTEYTYQDVFNGMVNISRHIENNNLKNKNIILMMGNTPEMVYSILGVSLSGNTFIPVGPATKPQRLQEIIDDSGASMIITNDKLMMTVSQCQIMTTLVYEQLDDQICTFGNPTSLIAAIMYTSGSTGKPKGVMCTHQQMLSAIHAINEYMFHTRTDVVATALPLSHGYGLYQILTVFAAGGTVLLEENFNYPARTLERIKQHQCTGFAAVPSAVQMFMQVDGWQDSLNRLEYLTTAGAALSPTVFETLIDELPDTQIIPMYGQTECVRVFAYPQSFESKPTLLKSCGVPIPGTTAYLISDDGNVDPSYGELVIESDHVMSGYWNKPHETAATFINGKLHTGDIFACSDGMYFYVGRKDDVVKIKGERTSPQELDDALLHHSNIIDAASFVVEDTLWGYRFIAYVVVDDPSLTKRDIMGYCKRNFEGFMMPKDVVLCTKIPKTENGKVSRPMLKQSYLEN